MYLHFFFLIALLLLPTPVLAERAPVYLKAVSSPVFWGSDALRIGLDMDEQACKKAYAQNWIERCAAAPGQPGALARGISMTPSLPGEWRWSEASALTFTPREAWPANTTFTIQLEKLQLPGHIVLAGKKLSLSTPPLGASLAPGTVWIDPDPQARHAVSFPVRFSTPPDRDVLTKNITLTSTDPTLKLGPVECVWLEEDTRCVIKAALLSLPAKEATVTLQIGKTAAMAENDGEWTIHHKRTPRQSVTVPGKTDLFAIKKGTLAPELDAGLNLEYRLTFETTLRVRPSDLLKQLRLIQLPRTQNPEATAPYIWTAAPQITEDDLNKGTALKAEALQPDEPATTLTFRVPAAVDSYVFAFLPAGPQTGLTRPWRDVFQAKTQGPVIQFLQPGTILALNGAHTLDLRTAAIHDLRWRAVRVVRPMLGYLASDASSFSENAYKDPDLLGESVEGQLSLTPPVPGKSQFVTLDMAPVVKGGHGLVHLELTGFNAEGKEVEKTNRFLLVTDLGVVDKQNADGTREVFACSLSSGAPLSGATVAVLGVNGQPVASAETDPAGRAVLPSVEGLTREKRPVALTVSLKDDLAWLPLDDSEREVDYSRFPIEGQTGSNEGLNAFVFAERGLFRPGEVLHFGTLVRRGDWKPLPSGTPFTAILRNPAGRVVMQRAFTPQETGLVSFAWQSAETAPAGRYTLDILAPGPDSAQDRAVLGSGSVLVQDFQPDTLTVAAEVPNASQGWVSPQALALNVNLKNLYGLPATDRRVRAHLTVTQGALQFPGYETYTFYDAAPYTGTGLTKTLPEQTSDAKGNVVIPLGLEQVRGGTLFCSILVEGFEPDGGRAASTMKQVLVSPLHAVLGARPVGTGTNLNYIPQGSAAELEFLALDAHLQRINPGPLAFSVAERRHVTSLVTDSSGRYRYDETPVDRELAVSTQTIDPRKGLLWSIPTEKPGQFVLNVRDTQSRLLASIPYTIAGNDDLRPTTADHLAESRLRMHTDKTNYKAGDTVKLFLSAPYAGTALLTLERDRVLTHKWFAVQPGNSTQSIPIPEDFEGRAYINVSLARSLNSPEIFMEPHSYAVAPLAVNIERRDMALQLTASELVAPGQKATVTLKSRVPGKALLFAVDEGVLQLTRFGTPDPLRYLLTDRALEVRTRQFFDLLMPDHGQLSKYLPAFGGGMDLGSGRFDNPFKRKGEPPLSWWSDQIDVGPQGTVVSIPIPDYYNGRIRIMAVGASPETAGNAETATIVRAPVILTPQVPILVSPGDRFEAGLAVANTVPASGAPVFKLSIEAPASLEVHNLPATVTVPEGREVLVPFSVKVGAQPGATGLRFVLTAPDGSQTFRWAALSVRPASPQREQLTNGTLTGPTDLKDPRTLYPLMAEASLSVSTLPLPAARGLLRYLDAYPYGCTEQLISRALPYALLSRQTSLLSDAGSDPDIVRATIRRQTEAAVQAIQTSLMPYTGISPWPDGSGTASTLLTAYAADYVLALREAGLPVPGGLFNEVMNTLESALNHAPDSLPEGRAQAYGLWVLTREGRITAQLVEQLAAQLDDAFPAWRSDVTASLLAGSCSIMRMDKQAEAFIAGYQAPGKQFEAGQGMDSLAAQSLHVAVLARNFPSRLDTARDELAAALLERLNGNRYMTFSAAQGIRALLMLSKTDAGDLSKVQLTCTRMQPGFPAPDATQSLSDGMLSLRLPGCAAYRIETPAGRPLYWELSSRGFDTAAPTKATQSGMEISRVYLDSAGQPATKVAQGDVITVQLVAQSYGEPLEDAVLVDLLPGGFEILLQQSPENAAPQGARFDRRDDRMLIFTPLTPEPQTFTYRIRAVNRGVFSLPPAQAEAMYDRTRNANTGTGTITVQ